MTMLLKIKKAIERLPEEEVRQLAAWIQDYLNQLWEKQVEAELESVKLSKSVAQARADIVANQARDLDEVLRNS